MNRLTLALTLILLFVSASTHAQSIARVDQTTNNLSSTTASTRAIAALKRLENDVLVYRSLADFEGSGKLARVSLPVFEQRLFEVMSEVQPVLSRMPASKIKTQLTNALDSYRDGVFWWRRVDEPRVVHVSQLSAELTSTRSETAFRSTIPYTVAIHWRQAHKYLNQAENLVLR